MDFLYAGYNPSVRVHEIFDDLFGASNFDGVSVGNNIYLRHEIPEDSNGNVALSPEFAALIGHEAIHSVQADAAGKMSMINYSLNMPYTQANRYERAAYTYSGVPWELRDNFRRIWGNTSIFEQLYQNGQLWW